MKLKNKPEFARDSQTNCLSCMRSKETQSSEDEHVHVWQAAATKIKEALNEKTK
jgi:hypothetical protein